MSTASLPVLQEVRTSNMVTFRKCERKAFFEVVLGQREEGGQQFDFGTITHKMLENWLQRAEPPPSGAAVADWSALQFAADEDFAKKIGKHPSAAIVVEAAAVARKGLHLLPTPGPGLVVEEPFSVRLPNGVLFKSHGIDLYDNRPSAYFRLHDHKTCKTLDFVPTSEEQRDNVQLISYGHELMRRFPDWGTVLHTRWIYYPRSNAAAVAVDCSMPKFELRQRWEGIVADVDRFKAYAEQLSPAVGVQDGWKDVKPNYDHCDDYRGCQFRSRCNAAGFSYDNWQEQLGESPEKKTESPQTTNAKEDAMGLMDRARNGEVVGASVSAPPPVPQATPAAQQPAPQAGGSSLFKRQAPAPVAAPVPLVQSPPAQQLQQLLAGTGVEPSEGEDEDDPTLDEGGELVGEFPPVAGSDVIDAQQTAAPAFGVLPPDAAPASETPPPPKKRGKGKKAEAQSEATPQPAAPPEIAAAVERLEQAEAAQKPTIPNPSVEIDPTPPERKPTSERASIVVNMRKAAERAASAGTHTGDDQALALFLAAQAIERGEL